MAIPATELREQRYLGDSATKVFHDLYHEDPTPGGCETFRLVRSGNAVRFEPDASRQAREDGYQPCDKCFHGIERRRSALTRELLDRPGEGAP